MIKIGNCPDSWGVWFEHDDRQMDWRQYLDEVAEAGYKYTEIGPYSYMSTDPKVLKAELDQRGLVPVGGTLCFDIEDDSQMPEVEGKAHRACELLQALGAKYYVLYDGMYTDLITDEQTLPKTLTDAQFDSFVRNYIKIGEIAKSYGVRLVFHPHGGTHVEYEGQIERVLSQTTKDEMTLCLDTGHHIFCEGNDVYTFTEQHGDRIEYLHLKDLVPETKEKMWAQGIPYATATKMNVFAEIGKGQIDWPRYSGILKKIGFDGFAVIEHDCYPADFAVPKVIQSRTGKYLEGIGLGSLK
ncbi:sugar phosphate isomerase/epimerase [Intestinibacillus massiliensis]|nr:sugar phosphate isomerase/epimerase [Intestinibacillus massiliensis]